MDTNKNWVFNLADIATIDLPQRLEEYGTEEIKEGNVFLWHCLKLLPSKYREFEQRLVVLWEKQPGDYNRKELIDYGVILMHIIREACKDIDWDNIEKVINSIKKE